MVCMQVFINDAITNGINAFIAKCDHQEYEHVHTFELSVIEFLATLYGEINITNPYRIMNAGSFKNNLMVYGASPEKIDKLFSLLKDYNDWLNSVNNPEDKNTIIADIFEILSYLVFLRAKSVKISDDEMKYYEDYLNVSYLFVNQF